VFACTEAVVENIQQLNHSLRLIDAAALLMLHLQTATS